MAQEVQLYDKDRKPINPKSEAKSIDCEASGTKSTVHQDIVDLYKQISALQKDDEAASNIIIEVRYKLSKSKIKANVVDPDGWGMEFTNPDEDYPYVWKRTRITYKGSEDGGNTTYEIVASANAEITETIYRAVADNSQPIISYIDEVTGKDDPHKYDNSIPENWSPIPVSISAQAPNAFMAIRTKKDGVWGRYSEIPIQYGRWAFDSNVVFRYQHTDTSDVPELAAAAENPGDAWKKTHTEAKKGYVWMINATEVNGQLQTYDNIVWNGPNLISFTV